MNRNTLFTSVRSEVHAKRSRFDLSKRNMTTFSQGSLVPIYCNTDILAGDTFDISTKLKIRSRTPLAPVMDNARLDTYWFFTPYRNVWDGTKAFYGDSDPSAWISPTEKFIPALTIDSLGGQLATISKTAGFSDKLLGSLWDHFGLPLISYNGNNASEIPINALAFRAYKLIWNEWFRDENLQDAQFVNTSDTATLADYYPVDENGNYIPMLPACRLHDFFSSCLLVLKKGIRSMFLWSALLRLLPARTIRPLTVMILMRRPSSWSRMMPLSIRPVIPTLFPIQDRTAI